MANWFDNIKGGTGNAFNNYVNFMNSNPTTRGISRVAGSIGGYQPLEAIRDFSKGNIKGGILNTAEGLGDIYYGKGLAGAGINAAKTASTAAFKPFTKGVLNKLSLVGLASTLFGGEANATPSTTQTSNTSTITPTTKVPTTQAPDFSNMTQAQKLDWIANNDIGSKNFNKAYQQNNPIGALEQKMLGLTSPEIELAYKQQLRDSEENYNRLLNQLDAETQANKAQLGIQQRGVNQQTTGSNLDLRSALASTGMLDSPGQYGVGQESNIRQGNDALAQLAQAYAAKNQNIINQKSQADIQRRESRNAAIQNKAAQRTALLNQYLSLGGL